MFHARTEVEFYRKRITESQEIGSPDDFSQIPLTSRDELAQLSRDILFSSKVQPHVVGLTSGSTYKSDSPFLYRLRNREEANALHALYRTLEQAEGERPLTLCLINANHGAQIFESVPGQISMPFEQPYHFDVIVDLLRGPFQFEGYESRVSSLVAPLQALKVLTSKLIENGIGADNFAVDQVSTFAWRLTPTWRSRLEEYWQSPVSNIYGLSEVPGLSARICQHCTTFHFAPTAYVEMLDPETDTYAESGVARLVATAFYPLAEILPILRYDTGDFFLIRGRCAVTGKLGYEFLGRRSQLIETPEHWPGYVSFGLIADALDAFPEITRAVNPRVQNLKIETEVGNPLFDAHLNEGRLTVEVHLSNKNAAGHEEITLLKTIRKAISVRLARFGSTLPADGVDVLVSPSGDYDNCHYI